MWKQNLAARTCLTIFYGLLFNEEERCAVQSAWDGLATAAGRYLKFIRNKKTKRGKNEKNNNESLRAELFCLVFGAYDFRKIKSHSYLKLMA